VRAAELAAALERRAPEIARASSEGMLADPFWAARFGARGDHHTRQDGDFHVGYLVQALRLESPGLLENYARWLRGVLVPRGMCSHHLREHFRVLGEEVARRVHFSASSSLCTTPGLPSHFMTASART